MSDKTCGTCVCGQQPSVWCSCADQIKPAGQAACGDYFERTDSVEQVAKDAIAALAAICADCCEDRCRDLADLGWPDDFCTSDIIRRAKELGVI